VNGFGVSEKNASTSNSKKEIFAFGIYGFISFIKGLQK
jgi:hypothetical protein